MATMRVATWNVHALRGASAVTLTRIAETLVAREVDAVAIQEVRLGVTATMLVEQLEAVGLSHVVLAAAPPDDARPKRYGTLLASRWPMSRLSWPATMRWPQLATSAVIHAPTATFRLIGAHIPNGSGNGWEKVYAFEALAKGLEPDAQATILAGDFNEPRSFLPRFETFRTPTPEQANPLFTDLHGVTEPRQRWHAAVAHVLHTEAADRGWPGQHAELQIGKPFEPSHRVRGRWDRYFDHIMTTPDLPVIAMEYDHAVRTSALAISDHSLVVATIRLDT